MECSIKHLLFRYALWAGAAIILVYLWNRLFKRFKINLSMNTLLIIALVIFFLTIIPCLSFGGKGPGGSGMRGNAGSSGASSSPAGGNPASFEWTITINSKGPEKFVASIETGGHPQAAHKIHGPYPLNQQKTHDEFVGKIKELRKDRSSVHVRLVLPASLKATVSVRAIEELLRSCGLVIQETDYTGGQ